MIQYFVRLGIISLLLISTSIFANEMISVTVSVADSHTPDSLAELQSQYRLLLDLKNKNEISLSVFENRKSTGLVRLFM